MTSFARFYNLHLNLYDVISDDTDRGKFLRYHTSSSQNNSAQGYQYFRSQASQSN